MLLANSSNENVTVFLGASMLLAIAFYDLCI